MSEYLELSTVVNPPAKFLVDGVEYEMYSTDHLSPEEEASVVAWLSRHSILTYELSLERNPAKGKVIAERARKTRVTVIEKLTNLPNDVIERLPLSQQAALLEAIEKLVGPEESDDPASDTDDPTTVEDGPSGSGAPDLDEDEV